MIWIVVIILVDDGMNHDSLFVNRERAVGWNGYPTFCAWLAIYSTQSERSRLTTLKCQWLTSH